MKDMLIDIAITAGVTVVTMAVINRTFIGPYVSGEKKIFGVV